MHSPGSGAASCGLFVACAVNCRDLLFVDIIVIIIIIKYFRGRTLDVVRYLNKPSSVLPLKYAIVKLLKNILNVMLIISKYVIYRVFQNYLFKLIQDVYNKENLERQ